MLVTRLFLILEKTMQGGMIKSPPAGISLYWKRGAYMALQNKLGLTDSAALAREEERLSKKRAAELYDSGYLDTLTPGTWASLAEIHRFSLRTFMISPGKCAM